MQLMLVNYRHAASQPYRSIMHLPRERAFAMAAQLYRSGACPAHRRFGPDFEAYYEYRLKIESELYKEFNALGGTPQLHHPYYFFLERCDAFYENFDKGLCVTLPLEDIDSSDISFSFGDSMAQFEKNDRQPLFLKETLYSYIEMCNRDTDAFLNKILPRYTCIEAQLWTDRYFPSATEPGV